MKSNHFSLVSTLITGIYGCIPFFAIKQNMGTDLSSLNETALTSINKLLNVVRYGGEIKCLNYLLSDIL